MDVLHILVVPMRVGPARGLHRARVTIGPTTLSGLHLSCIDGSTAYGSQMSQPAGTRVRRALGFRIADDILCKRQIYYRLQSAAGAQSVGNHLDDKVNGGERFCPV